MSGQLDSYFFPSVEKASPEGLLAVGGDLDRERLLLAYRNGIFPWYSYGQPILWWSPDPRMVFYIGKLKMSRSLRKTLRNSGMRVTMDTAFEDVMRHCAAPRDTNHETWITPDMHTAYCDLYLEGQAHSVEVWHEQKLIGGLYGVALGTTFFGESMFTRERDASKVALMALDQQLQKLHFRLIDCQLPSPHLYSLGAQNIERKRFIAELKDGLQESYQPGHWQFELDATLLI